MTLKKEKESSMRCELEAPLVRSQEKYFVHFASLCGERYLPSAAASRPNTFSWYIVTRP